MLINILNHVVVKSLGV